MKSLLPRILAMVLSSALAVGLLLLWWMSQDEDSTIGLVNNTVRAQELLESRRHPVARMHTHDFKLSEAELAIRTLAREIPDDESIHSCLIPEH